MTEIKSEYFKRTPRWKMFFIRLFGEKTVYVEHNVCCISYKFRGKSYFDRIVNGFLIVDHPREFSFGKICDPQKWN